MAAALILAFSSGTLSAATWIVVYGDEKVAIVMDGDSIRQQGSIVKVWAAWYHANPIDDLGMPTYQSAKRLYSLNCADRSMAVLQSIYYSDPKMSQVVSSTKGQSKPNYADVAPETLGETILEMACKHNAK